MDINFYKRATIDLHQDDVDTFREVVRMAADRLASAPSHQMRGVPLQRQAGLTGVDLFRARSMLENLGKHFGLDITESTWDHSPADSTTALVAIRRST